MKILVLGASGGIGKWVVKLAHQKGFKVTAVIRSSSSYQPPEGVNIIRGEVTDPGFVHSIVDDEITIISCVGIRRAGKSPWAKIQSPPNLVETVNSNIVEASKTKKNVRLIWISAAGVGESRQNCTPIIKKMITLGNIGVSYQDLEKAEKLIHDSGLNVVTVRPVTLIPGNPTSKAMQVGKYTLFSIIRRSDVAEWILKSFQGMENQRGHAIISG